jgi:hypothetical protein
MAGVSVESSSMGGIEEVMVAVVVLKGVAEL